LPEGEKRKGIGKMPVKERLVSISAGYERERAHQIVQGISELLDVPLREAIKRADSVRIFERLDVEPDSLLPKVKEFTNRFKQRETNLAGQCVIDEKKGTIYRDPKLPKAA
jgi:hypothetical protein